MSIFQRLEEEASHDLTLVHGLRAGISTYCCELCGALVMARGDEVVLFHVPPLAASTEVRCDQGLQVDKAGDEGQDDRSLKAKLAKLEADDYERLKLT